MMNKGEGRLYELYVVLCVCQEEGKTEDSFVITEDVLLLAPLAFVLESLLRIRTQLTVTAHVRWLAWPWPPFALLSTM